MKRKILGWKQVYRSKGKGRRKKVKWVARLMVFHFKPGYKWGH